MKKKKPDPNYEHIIENKRKLHEERMFEEVENDLEEIPYQAFEKAYEKIKSKSGKKYEFYKNAGTSLKMAVFNLFRIIWKREKIPSKWMDSTLIQLSKDKKKVGELDSMRHIHDRKEIFKWFGLIVTISAKETIFNGMTKFQIACKPGHRPSEHLFVHCSVISHYQKEHKVILASSYDLKKLFDFEELTNSMDSL